MCESNTPLGVPPGREHSGHQQLLTLALSSHGLILPLTWQA